MKAKKKDPAKKKKLLKKAGEDAYNRNRKQGYKKGTVSDEANKIAAERAEYSAKKNASKAYDNIMNFVGDRKYKKGGKVYKTGGKAPVDPPKTSPDSKSSYNIGNMSFQGEEADRLIAFSEHLEKDFPNLDMFQRAEQVEKFVNSKAYKSNDAMKAYNVDPALKNAKAPSLKDSFDDAFGESSFGGGDPFEDDPDIQRMRAEAAARDNKKGKRGRKYESGGKVIKNYKKGGKVFKAHNMYRDGKVVKAKSMADHLRLKKQGYSHKKG